MKRVIFFAVLGILFSSVFLIYCSNYEENLVPNGDFETECPNNPDMPACWTYAKRWSEGGHYWVTDEVCSGKRAVKIEAIRTNSPEGSSGTANISISSQRFSAPPANTMLYVSAWIKAQNVVSPGSYYKLRFVIYFWDAEGKKLQHHDILCADGSFDWRKIESMQVVPEGAKTISLMFGLTACTGTGWIDDVRVGIHRAALTEEYVFKEVGVVECPIIIPYPWKVKVKNGQVDINRLAIRGIIEETRLKKAMEKYFKDKNLPYRFITKNEQPTDYEALLISGDASEKVLSQRLKESFPEVNWKDLNDQGYFLSIGKEEGKTVIYLGANTEQGRFYGLQSLRQLLEKEEGVNRLPSVDIVDKPTVSCRGMAMGLQWFNQREKAIERLSAMKCNFIYNGGTFLNNKFGGNYGANWREPFTKEEILLLKNYLKLAEDNFIKVYISFSPRLGNPPIRYSSEEDINIIVEKMSALYEAGFRNFGLNYDDLQNVGLDRLTDPEDIKKFENDIGRAHYYYTSEVYNRLRKKHPDISFGVLPLWYGGFTIMNESSKDYLRTMGRLPKEIIFISCPTDEANIAEAMLLTGRKHLIWDNYFAGWEKGRAPVFVPPIDRERHVSDNNVSGYIFLPMTPAREDAAMTSWMTAADYMWSPERYDPDKSFRRAIIHAVGGNKNVALLEEYYRYIISGIRKIKLPYGEELQTLELRKDILPDSNKEQRLLALEEGRQTLNHWKKRFEAIQTVLPEQLFVKIQQEIESELKEIQLLQMENKEKPFPVKVRKTGRPINWSKVQGLTDFYIMAGEGKKAKQQTSVYLLYDDENFYIKVVLQEPEPDKIKADCKERDRNVFSDDCVEIFIDTTRDRKTYFHIVVNSIGTVYDAVNYDSTWDGKYTVVTTLGEDCWTLEMAIPFRVLGITSVKPGDRWNFNICRERYASERELSSYALLLRPNFHAPERFCTLEFE